MMTQTWTIDKRNNFPSAFQFHSFLNWIFILLFTSLVIIITIASELQIVINSFDFIQRLFTAHAVFDLPPLLTRMDNIRFPFYPCDCILLFRDVCTFHGMPRLIRLPFAKDRTTKGTATERKRSVERKSRLTDTAVLVLVLAWYLLVLPVHRGTIHSLEVCMHEK